MGKRQVCPRSPPNSPSASDHTKFSRLVQDFFDEMWAELRFSAVWPSLEGFGPRIAGPSKIPIITVTGSKNGPSRNDVMPDYIEVCEKAVRGAGALLLDRIGRVKVYEKGPADLVTEADLAAQQFVRKVVLEAFPDHLVLGEEDQAPVETRRATGCPRWIVDPLDGTTNYVHQVPFFAVSLALEQEGDLLVGAVYHPSADEYFLALPGQGAYRNGVRIHTSNVISLGSALVSVGFPSAVTADCPDLRLFNEAVLLSQSIRRTGSVALNLAYVAAGHFDVAWSYCAKVWDVAAGKLLIREAGGVATSFAGEDLPLEHGPALAAANRPLHGEMMALIRRLGLR